MILLREIMFTLRSWAHAKDCLRVSVPSESSFFCHNCNALTFSLSCTRFPSGALKSDGNVRTGLLNTANSTAAFLNLRNKCGENATFSWNSHKCKLVLEGQSSAMISLITSRIIFLCVDVSPCPHALSILGWNCLWPFRLVRTAKKAFAQNLNHCDSYREITGFSKFDPM